jgi:hypothetical protein
MTRKAGKSVRPNHNAVLARNGVTMKDTVANVLAVFDRATPADMEAGARWYGEDAAALISDLARAGNVTREVAASVVAQLSPRTTWSRNVAAASAMLTAWGSNADSDAVVRAAYAVGAMRANVARALKVLINFGHDCPEEGEPFDLINGPKTNAFARNLCGDRNAVTVDVWAARIALNPGWSRGDTEDTSELLLGRAGMYDALAQAYRLAAAKRGVDPTTMQATSWVVMRNGRAG